MTQGVDKVVEAAKIMLKLQGYFVDNLWHVADIHFICEQLGVATLSDTEAMGVFELANEQFDGEAGINWPQLEKALLLYLKQKRRASAAENM